MSNLINEFISLRIIKGKVYAAYVKEKEEARRNYEDAVKENKTAGHLELR